MPINPFRARRPKTAPAHSDRSVQPNRRAFLKGSALAALLLVRPTLAAAQRRPGGPGPGGPGRDGGRDGGPPRPTIDPSVTTLPNPASGPAFDAKNELVIGFKFVSAGGGDRFHNPYLAVWLEDAAENLIRTLKLEYQQGRGDRWLPDLRRWFYRDQVRITTGGKDVTTTISGPTRVPGSYKVVWDGTDSAKKPVPQGSYFLCIEAAREKGPYQLIREKIDITAKPFVKKIADSGELQGAGVELRARAK